MKCSHCLRGKAQNKTMKREYLTRFLSQIHYIGTVTFTGGEPTLPSGQKVIRDFMDVCIQEGVSVGNFYIVTNAKIWRPELPKLIKDLYNFCEDNEISLLDISSDQFHDPIQLQRSAFKSKMEDILLYKYGITKTIVGMRPSRLEYHSLVLEGRAKELQLGGHNFSPPEVYVYDNEDELDVTEGEIYLNCDGNIILGCDWSYESQKDPKYIICSVYDDFDKAIRNLAGIDEKVEAA
jgi:MoaA/NifB/PqqE/SkfB family radical SAM enzyme